MVLLRENATLEMTGSKVRVRLINEGQGSSGNYSAQVLQETGSTAFPAGTFLFYNHVSPDKRDIRDAFGVLDEAATFSVEDKELSAPATIFEEHQNRVKNLFPHVAMSIEAAGDIDRDGNVTALLEDPFNAVAMVHRGGRGGKITGLLESAIIDSDDQNNRKDAGMTPEEIEQVAAKLTEAMAPLFAALTESLKPAVPEVKDEAGEMDALEVAEALVASELPEAARKRVAESVKGGSDLAEAIEAEKTYIKGLTEAITANNGRVVLEGEKPAGRITVNADGWN